MTHTTPKLDPVYKGKSYDWSFQTILKAKGETIESYPESYKNPYAVLTAPRDQGDRGTCTGQASAYCYDILYMMLTKDLPSESDKAQYKPDVVDELGTTHDILYPQSASAEGFYSTGRTIGNITYPAGGEIKFCARGWTSYGMNLESQWHTDKTGHCCWSEYPRQTSDGGLSKEDAAAFATKHRSEGYAYVGIPAGSPTWDQTCSALYKQGFLLGAIPIYENYMSMAGGDGSFPDPRGELAGFHALCFYAYDADRLYFLHSWGNWCGRFGSISKEFFRQANDLIQFYTIIDTGDVLIARDAHTTLTITATDKTTNAPLAADLYINNTLIGTTPQKIALINGTKTTITAKMNEYVTQTMTVNDSETTLNFSLEHVIATPPKSWWITLLETLTKFFLRK